MIHASGLLNCFYANENLNFPAPNHRHFYFYLMTLKKVNKFDNFWMAKIRKFDNFCIILLLFKHHKLLWISSHRSLWFLTRNLKWLFSEQLDQNRFYHCIECLYSHFFPFRLIWNTLKTTILAFQEISFQLYIHLRMKRLNCAVRTFAQVSKDFFKPFVLAIPWVF